MEKVPLFQRGSLSGQAYTAPTPAVLDLLEQTDYGTGGLTYRHGNVQEKIAILPHPYFITIEKSEDVMGTIALSRRYCRHRNAAYRSYYIRYFSFQKGLRRPNGHAADRQAAKPGNRIIRPLIDQLFATSDPADANAVAEPTVYYAYVEADNQRSYEMCTSFGFQPLRTMTTIPFSRAYPKAQSCVRLLQEEEQPQMLHRLEQYYQGYTLATFDRVFAGKHYYVWEQDGQILGGVQAYPISWRFQSLPGTMGWLSMHVVPHLPVLGRLFQPKNYRFAALEGLWIQPGHETLLPSLIEGALAHEQLKVGMFFVDKGGPQYSMVKGVKNLGLMYTLNGEVDSQIIGRFANPSSHDLEHFQQTPAYISAFDCT